MECVELDVKYTSFVTDCYWMLNANVAAPGNICTFLFERDNRRTEVRSPTWRLCNECGTVVLVAGDSLRSYRANLKNACMYIMLS